MSAEGFYFLCPNDVPDFDATIRAGRGDAPIIFVERQRIDGLWIAKDRGFRAGLGVPNLDGLIVAGRREASTFRAPRHGIYHTSVTSKRDGLGSAFDGPNVNGLVFAARRQVRFVGTPRNAGYSQGVTAQGSNLLGARGVPDLGGMVIAA